MKPCRWLSSCFVLTGNQDEAKRNVSASWSLRTHQKYSTTEIIFNFVKTEDCSRIINNTEIKYTFTYT